MWDFMKNLFKGIGTFFKDFLKTEAGKIVNEIGELAFSVVHSVEIAAPSKTGEEKFEEAFKMLVLILKDKKIMYTKQAVNTAIEIAVGILKDKK